MDILSIILIAVGLAMDCFAVSTTKGLQEHRWCAKAFLMAVLFGLFQGGMPLVGYFAGTIFADFFAKFAPWIALILLSFIGGKMIWESFHEESDSQSKTDWSQKTLIVLAIATSIDALATGVIFIPCPEVMWLGIGVIAFMSFVLSLCGYLIGAFVGEKFKLNAELIGGLVLIAISIKIFIEGVCF